MTLNQIESSIQRFRTISQEVIVSKDLVITDMEKFIATHISYLRSNKGNMAYMPYYSRLLRVFEYLEKNESSIHQGI